MTDCSSWFTSRDDRPEALMPVSMTTMDLILKPRHAAQERMRLMIQVTVSLEILISCILGSDELWFGRWANQPPQDT